MNLCLLNALWVYWQHPLSCEKLVSLVWGNSNQGNVAQEIKLSESYWISLLMSLKKSEEGTVKSLPRPSTESDIWVPEHLTPSWVCLPNDQPVLTTIQPGESALCVLETICKVTQPDPLFVFIKHFACKPFWHESHHLWYKSDWLDLSSSLTSLIPWSTTYDSNSS